MSQVASPLAIAAVRMAQNVLEARRGRRLAVVSPRGSSIGHALEVARSHVDSKSPLRGIVRTVEVPIQPTARGAEVMVTRLELDCGHLVPLPGGALAGRTKPGVRCGLMEEIRDNWVLIVIVLVVALNVYLMSKGRR